MKGWIEDGGACESERLDQTWEGGREQCPGMTPTDTSEMDR